MENIIEIKNLNKSFGDVHAVNNLSFNVKKGEFFAFLGENGAGKSTTISIMSGTLSKDSGSAVINGKNVDDKMAEISKEIGIVFQSSVLDSCLTVKDNLLSRASLYGIYGAKATKKIDELATMLDFQNILNRQIMKLSGGQKRRIDVARALIHNPKILILDEPTTGLDPQTRKNMWKVIDYLRKTEDMTVFLTTHYMEEVADADYVVILDSGKICAEGTPIELKNKYASDYITIYNKDEKLIKELNLPYEKLNNAFRVEIKDCSQAKSLLQKYPALFDDFELTKGKMDDVFLAVTGKKLEGGN